MLATNKSHVFYAILVMVIAQVQCTDFMCYVCDDCAKVTKDTPKAKCDETFFDKATTMPTNDATTTTASATTTTEQPTTLPTTTLTAETATATATKSTINITTLSPATEGTIVTTTPSSALPNPSFSSGPIEVEIAALNETTSQAAITERSTIFNSDNNGKNLTTTFLVPVNGSDERLNINSRQRRAAIDPAFTYHCYSVQQSVNGTKATSRGCSRISPKESVCNALEQANNNTKYSICNACSNSLCNSSSSLAISFVAMFMGIMAIMLFRTPA